MSWADRIGNAKGSFRGVEFWVERTSARAGRRVQVHEYPERDRAYAEDLGRSLREWSIECYFLGDDYDLQRNAFLDAVEIPGAGELVHPYYGRHQVVVTEPARIRESTRESGMARVSLTVMPAEDTPRLPTTRPDTAAQVKAAADAAQQSAIEDFVDRFNTVELAAERVRALQTHIDRTLASLEAAIGSVTGPLAELIRAPANFAGSLVGSMGRIATAVGEPGRALEIYSGLFDAGSDPAEPSLSAPEQLKTQVEAQRATNDLVRRSAVIQAAADSADRDWSVADEAIEAQQVIVSGVEQQLARVRIPDDAVYQRLRALRAASVEDLTQRGANLPQLTTYTPNTLMPALVVAQRLYGDARRADEIVQRNRVRHPGAVPGGEPLEVTGE